MWIWLLSLAAGVAGAALLATDLRTSFARIAVAMRLGAERRALDQVTASLLELQETLEAGLLPDVGKWERLRELRAPWGELSYESVTELRACGGSLVPTLKRIRALAEAHRMAMADARAKSAQAMTQAIACAALVPIFGGTLYALLPGVSEYPVIWSLACGLAGLSSLLGAAWLLRMSDQARWAGVEERLRPGILGVQCAGERFLALVRAGSPADIAWTRAHALLLAQCPEISPAWGGSVWDTPAGPRLNASTQMFLALVGSLRKSIQVSLMEGRPCTERVENALQGFRQDLRAQVDRELTVLGTRALKPLFVCVAPALLGMLTIGLYLGWLEVSVGL